MKKNHITNLLIIFLFIIPVGAVGGSYAIHNAFGTSTGGNVEAVTTKQQNQQASKYSIDMGAKQVYRVDIKKFKTYEEAEAQVQALKKKKLNGFILKEEGYVVTYGMYASESQAKSAVQFLSRKRIQGTAGLMDINPRNLHCEDGDKKLIQLVSALDGVVEKIISEKSSLSLESLYSNKKISGQSLDKVVKLEEQISKYLNYLKDINTTDEDSDLKSRLENMAKEVLIDGLSPEGSYDYYNLQNSLMNQAEALKKFYEMLS
jgi:hypothetical protein